MKTVKILLISILVISSFSINAQIKVLSNGSTGIGCTPYTGYKLQVLGNTSFITSGYEIRIDNYGGQAALFPDEGNTCYVGTPSSIWYNMYTYKIYRYFEGTLSDNRLKSNVRDLNNPFDIINKINAFQFDYTEEAFKNVKGKAKDEMLERGKNNYGFMAQDVKEVVPYLVDYDDSTDIYYLFYEGFIPILFQAVKEIKKDSEKKDSIILSLEERILILEKEVSKITDSNSKLKSTTFSDEEITTSEDNLKLYQNTPNPFSENTSIEYYLPSTIQKAQFYIYDMQGKQIKSINLTERENGAIVIYGNELKAGIYYYSIIADGKIIGMEKMVLTD